MKRMLLWVLLLIACFGLGFCLVKIVLRVVQYVKERKISKDLCTTFKGLSWSFNLQYKAMRPFIEDELTSKQILTSISDDDKEILFNRNHLYIIFPDDAWIVCKDTVMVRECFVMIGALLGMMKECLTELDLTYSDPVFDENEQFLKELHEICIQKGERTFYDMNDFKIICDMDDVKQKSNVDQEDESMEEVREYADVDEEEDYGQDFSQDEYYCEYDDDEQGSEEDDS